jgi:hypothetical protein
MNCWRKTLKSVLIVFILTLPLFAQTAKVERIGAAPSSAPADVKAALDDKGYRVTLDDGWSAELWLAKDLKLATKDAPGALYPELGNSEFVGVLNLPKGMSDFRGQSVPAGTYTLRYQLIPQDANHMGVSANPDFLLAIPIATDSKPDTTYSFDKLVALSAKSTGAHPAVIAMEKAGEPDTATFDEQKMLVVTVSAASATAKPRALGIVLKGQATQ